VDDGLILGLIIGISIGIGVSWLLSRLFSPPSPPTPTTQPKTSVHNKETWRWVDWEGKERFIEVERVVE